MTSLVERLRALDYNVDIAMHTDDADVIAEAADTLEALCEALARLAHDEADYRYNHDHFGGGDIRTGRAWDKMRNSGAKAIAALERVS